MSNSFIIKNTEHTAKQTRDSDITDNFVYDRESYSPDRFRYGSPFSKRRPNKFPKIEIDK